jgi:hypothetical protein
MKTENAPDYAHGAHVMAQLMAMCKTNGGLLGSMPQNPKVRELMTEFVAFWATLPQEERDALLEASELQAKPTPPSRS